MFYAKSSRDNSDNSVLDLKDLAVISIIFKSVLDYYDNFTFKFFKTMIRRSFYFRLFVYGLAIMFSAFAVSPATFSWSLIIFIEIYYAYVIYKKSGLDLNKALYHLFQLIPSLTLLIIFWSLMSIFLIFIGQNTLEWVSFIPALFLLDYQVSMDPGQDPSGTGGWGYNPYSNYGESSGQQGGPGGPPGGNSIMPLFSTSNTGDSVSSHSVSIDANNKIDCAINKLKVKITEKGSIFKHYLATYHIETRVAEDNAAFLFKHTEAQSEPLHVMLYELQTLLEEYVNLLVKAELSNNSALMLHRNYLDNVADTLPIFTLTEIKNIYSESLEAKGERFICYPPKMSVTEGSSVTKINADVKIISTEKTNVNTITKASPFFRALWNKENIVSAHNTEPIKSIEGSPSVPANPDIDFEFVERYRGDYKKPGLALAEKALSPGTEQAWRVANKEYDADIKLVLKVREKNFDGLSPRDLHRVKELLELHGYSESKYYKRLFAKGDLEKMQTIDSTNTGRNTLKHLSETMIQKRPGPYYEVPKPK